MSFNHFEFQMYLFSVAPPGNIFGEGGGCNLQTIHWLRHCLFLKVLNKLTSIRETDKTTRTSVADLKAI